MQDFFTSDEVEFPLVHIFSEGLDLLIILHNIYFICGHLDLQRDVRNISMRIETKNFKTDIKYINIATLVYKSIFKKRPDTCSQ
jgi:hypothetical protein